MNWPSTPPSARSRASAALTRGSDAADGVLLLAVLIAEFSAVPSAWLDAETPVLGETAAAGLEPPETARAIAAARQEAGQGHAGAPAEHPLPCGAARGEE